MLHFGDDQEMRRHERLLLRPWLENLIDSGKVPGLQWFDSTRTLFRVPWKHQSRKTWSLGHSSVFLEWAKNTGRWKEGDPEPHYAQLKTRLRCAFSKAPDIEEMKDLHCSKADEPYKVYRFVPKKESKLYPFGRKAIARKSIQKSLKRCSLVTGIPHSKSGNTADLDELMNCRKVVNGYEEMPVFRSNELNSEHVMYSSQIADSTTACLNKAPFHMKDYQDHLDMGSADLGRAQESHIARGTPNSCVYSHDQPAGDSVNISGLSRMDFKVVVSNEPMEVQEYFSAKRQTILPQIEQGIDVRPDSKSSPVESVNAVSPDVSPTSFDLSQNTNCGDTLMMKINSGRPSLGLLDLPAMSISEKVQSWNLTGSSDSADENGVKVVEIAHDNGAETCNKIMPSVGSFLPPKQRNWPPRADGDMFTNRSGMDQKDRSVLPKIIGEQSGSNIAVATPIFPLKNRYNISRNCPDKEKLNFPNENHYVVPGVRQDSFTNNDEQLTLDRGRANVDQKGFVKSSRQGLLSVVHDERLPDCVAVQRESFSQAFDSCNRNNQPFCRVSDNIPLCSNRNNQILPRTEMPQSKHLFTNGVLEEVRLFDSSCDRNGVNEPSAEPEAGRNWYERDARYDNHVDGSVDEPFQKESFVNKVQYKNVGSVYDRRRESWESCDQSSDRIQLMLQRSETLAPGSANIRGSQQDTFIKEAPLDLSNKASLLAHYGRINSGVEPFQSRAQMLRLDDERDRTTESYNCDGNFQMMDRSAEAEEYQMKKYGFSSNMNVGRLKAAYKKLVLRTMLVADKERELDDLEKRLLAREEAVSRKEEKLQKVLWTFSDARRESDSEKQFNGVKLLPPVDLNWRSDENCRKTCQNGSSVSPQTGRTEPDCFRTEKNTHLEFLPADAYSSQKSLEISDDVSLQYSAPRHISHHDENFEYSPTMTQHNQHVSDIRYSNQPIYDALPRRMSDNQGEFVYVKESRDAQTSDVFVPTLVHPRCHASELTSRDLSYNQTSAKKLRDAMDVADQFRASSGRMLDEDTGVTSLKSFLLKRKRESYDEASFAKHPTGELISYKSLDSDGALWGSTPAEGKNIVRILPPVFNAMKQ